MAQVSEQIHCRICNGAMSRAACELFKLNDNNVEMFRCRDCGTVQMCDLPSEDFLRDFYGGGYLNDYTAGMGEERFNREMLQRHTAKLELVRDTAGLGRLLDVGCGEGMFLELAKKAGYDCQGCDYGLKSSYPEGVEVKIGTLDVLNGLPFEDESFDVVTNWAVIEHVRSPISAAKEMWRVLRKGGYLFCDTPLCGDLCERSVAGQSHWFWPPEHLHVFSARSLRMLYESAGFRVIRSSPFYERTWPRWFARRFRNLAVGAVLGGVQKCVTPAKWKADRNSKLTPIGDIQLLVAQK